MVIGNPKKKKPLSNFFPRFSVSFVKEKFRNLPVVNADGWCLCLNSNPVTVRFLLLNWNVDRLSSLALVDFIDREVEDSELT